MCVSTKSSRNVSTIIVHKAIITDIAAAISIVSTVYYTLTKVSITCMHVNQYSQLISVSGSQPARD